MWVERDHNRGTTLRNREELRDNVLMSTVHTIKITERNHATAKARGEYNWISVESRYIHGW
jgi:hypothetical protein